MTIGFIGLGTMGSLMAARLIDEPEDVVVWNRTAAAQAQLVALGALGADHIANALAGRVSFSMLANDQAALHVLSPQNLESARGRIHISMSSLSPGAVDTIAAAAAAAGVTFLACPVLGRPAVAAAGKLNILAAGDESAIETARPLLARLGTKIWNLGVKPSTAAVVKVAVNYNIIHTIQALAESISLVESNGVRAGYFTDLLSNTLFGGVAYSGYGELIANRAYRPVAFSMALGRKDLGLAEEIAADAGFTLPTSAVLRRLFDEALVDNELAHDDWSALAEVTRRRAHAASERPAP